MEQADFKEVWRDQRYQAFRQAILTDRSKISICQNCSEGAKVWA
ncbi:MAG: SPASM domain-containing protein [Flavobacteriales bacterium]